MVCPELQLEALFGLALRRGQHPTVVDQQVESAMPGQEVVGEAGDGVQVGQIQRRRRDACVRGLVADPPHCLKAPVMVTACGDDVGALECQLSSGLESQLAVGAGHQGGPARLARDVVECPACHVNSLPIPPAQYRPSMPTAPLRRANVGARSRVSRDQRGTRASMAALSRCAVMPASRHTLSTISSEPATKTPKTNWSSGTASAINSRTGEPCAHTEDTHSSSLVTAESSSSSVSSDRYHSAR